VAVVGFRMTIPGVVGEVMVAFWEMSSGTLTVVVTSQAEVGAHREVKPVRPIGLESFIMGLAG